MATDKLGMPVPKRCLKPRCFPLIIEISAGLAEIGTPVALHWPAQRPPPPRLTSLAASATTDPALVDITRKFVRVLRRSDEGLVAFEFAIGWPDLAVELVLPEAAFDEFCALHRVVLLAELPTGAVGGALASPQPEEIADDEH
jgi:phenol hydroxylase P0 protein